MKRFKFRLQAVLEQRERIEKQAKSTYAEAFQALNKGKQFLTELEEVQEAIINELTEIRLSGEFCPNETRVYQEYLATITNCIRDQKQYVRDLASTAEALRLNLVGASQNRQVVDKLKEKQKHQHAAEAIRVEQSSIDELAGMRHHFRRSAENHSQ